jgi:hypothetical protein
MGKKFVKFRYTPTSVAPKGSDFDVCLPGFKISKCFCYILPPPDGDQLPPSVI